ncbi:Rop guanine nucleotide exchange factor 1 [Heracleum sosnowskyi]|uniref:Rop guanine nucleotide exchange factor 1 n=1 Tax=Heracleum sosnowskyi TaxID=360622 RepID=A0AAD8I857_9APIA|nr:Rop guanine nucleotide exchange factor 1 [Heracleum sosnowskyi]
MEIPDVYLESLPKSAKACLGETIYQYLTADQFSPECLLEYLEMSSEYTTLEIANRIEASVHIWRHKYFRRHLSRAKSGRSWGGKVKGLVSDRRKNKFLHQRAETLLRNLKLQFPGLPQTALDIQKIQYNKPYLVSAQGMRADFIGPFFPSAVHSSVMYKFLNNMTFSPFKYGPMYSFATQPV